MKLNFLLAIFLCSLVSFTRNQGFQIVGLNYLYHSDATIYCNQNGQPFSPGRDLNAQWQGIQFYYIPAASIDYSQMNNASSYSAYLSRLPFTPVRIDNQKFLFDSSKNMLTIKGVARPDTQIAFYCTSSSANQSVLFKPQVLPYLYLLNQQVYIVIEGYGITMNCQALYGFDNNEQLNFNWHKDNQYIQQQPSSNENIIISSNPTQHQTSIQIKQATLSDSGYFTCTAVNRFGQASRTMRLRVKSRLSPLWPALGVIAQAVLLVAIIFFCHKYKKMKKDN